MSNGHEVSAKCLAKIKKLAYFTIQLIFATINKFHCTF